MHPCFHGSVGRDAHCGVIIFLVHCDISRSFIAVLLQSWPSRLIAGDHACCRDSEKYDSHSLEGEFADGEGYRRLMWNT